MTTQDYNMKILAILTQAAKKYTDLRFGQILHSFDVVEPIIRDGLIDGLYDEYNTPSKNLLLRIQRAADSLLGESNG